MNNQELLSLYQQGERNFRRQNLSGLSFRRQNLAGADFSGADLRSTNFSEAILTGANFSSAQVGLRRREAVLLFICLLSLVALLGVAAGLVGTLLNLELRAFTSAFEEILAGWAMVLLLLAFAAISILEGITSGFSVFAIAFGVAVGLAAIGPLFSTLINPIAFAVSSAIALAITIVSSVTALTVVATIIMMSVLHALDLKAAIAILVTYLGLFGFIVYATDIVTSIVPVVPSVTLLTCYLGWRALQGDPKHKQIRRLSTQLVRNWGTNFYNANLTRADFSNVQFRNANFEGAMLAKTCWNGSQSKSDLQGFNLHFLSRRL